MATPKAGLISFESAQRIQAAVQYYEKHGYHIRAPRLRTSDDGGIEVRVGKTEAEIEFGASGNVVLYDNGEPGDPCAAPTLSLAGQTVCAHNLISTIASDEWVYILKPIGGQAWHIIGTSDQPKNTVDVCGQRTVDTITLAVQGCHGKNATATAHVAGDCPGAITSVKIFNPGSGYAVTARKEPALTISGGGTGATFTPTLAKATDKCGIETWSLSEVAVSGGTGYVDGESLTVVVNDGVQVTVASLTLKTSRSAPTLSAAASGGAGASLSVSTSAAGSAWEVSSVSVSSGGSGYANGSSITFLPGGGDVVASPARATITTARVAPTLAASANIGSGATFSVSLSASTDGAGRDVWGVSGITATKAGSNYAAGGRVYVTCTAGTTVESAIAKVATVNKTGGITAVTIQRPGSYYLDEGTIESVSVADGGSYYHEVPDEVTVAAGGSYYANDQDGEPYVDDVTVTLTQQSPSAGSGAAFTATVNTTPGSDFGTISSIDIDNGGTNYFDRRIEHDTTFSGIKFHAIPGYDGAVTQMLGHDPGGCLKWFSVTSCSADPPGVCCVDGAADEGITTKAACDTAGGTWVAGASVDDLPGPCCP